MGIENETVVSIDERFESLEQWTNWFAEHPFIVNRSYVLKLAEQIKANGFIEPMTLGRVTPGEIRDNGSFREGLLANGLCSRVRAILQCINEAVANRRRTEIRLFAPEAVTPLALFLRGRFARFIGSEYGATEPEREALFPIPHIDLMKIDMPDNAFDIVSTNEVLEHVPSIDTALAELCRILKPGGCHIGTHPFAFMDATGNVRARIVNGELEHLKEPEYHGNPISPEAGSLVFEIPGWDIIERAKRAGFSRAEMRFMASIEHGYMSEETGIFVLYAYK